MPDRRLYWVTIRLDACRTRDITVTSHSEWAAAWLLRQLHPEVEVLGVRPAREHSAS